VATCGPIDPNIRGGCKAGILLYYKEDEGAHFDKMASQAGSGSRNIQSSIVNFPLSELRTLLGDVL